MSESIGKHILSSMLSMLESQREYQHQIRLGLVELLGSKCVVCKNDDPRVLQIDHIDGHGLQDRKRFTTSERAGTPMYRYYLDHPEEAKQKLQLLCANCNWIKRYEKGETKVRKY